MALIFIASIANAAAAGPYAYIANDGNNTISFIGDQTNPLIAFFHHNTVTPWQISVIDTQTNAVIATIPIGIGPVGVAVSPDGTKIYVANNNSNTVSVINATTNNVTATIHVGIGPSGVAVSPDGAKIYVTNLADNTVSVIDAATNAVMATIPVGTYPLGIVVSPDGTKIYVTNERSNYVSVIDASTNTVIATVPVGTNPFGVVVNPAGTRLYVVNFLSYSVSVINTATNTVIATVPVGILPFGIAETPDGTKIYVTNMRANTVSVIDTGTNKLIATVPVGTLPAGVAVNPAGTKIYVTNSGNNYVSVIDVATNTVTSTVKVGNYPMAFGQFIVPATPAPTSTLYDQAVLPIAAVAVGSGLGFMGLFLTRLNDIFASISSKLLVWLKEAWALLNKVIPIDTLFDFLDDYVRPYAKSLFFKEESKLEESTALEHIPFLAGFSSQEMAVVLITSALLGVAYLVSRKMDLLQPELLVLYILVAGFAIILHDLTHRYAAWRYKVVTEYQFWGFGTVIMFVTALLFGIVYGMPARTVINDRDKLKPVQQAIVFGSGPLVSFLVSAVFLLLLPLGGALKTVGLLGCSMNLLSAVYSFMPFDPMDGNKVLKWRTLTWAAIFLPLILIYLGLTIFVF